MTKFRPCIDLHEGHVKQIVGGTLGSSSLKTNYVSSHPPAYYASLYKEHNLKGGHVIMLGEGNEIAAKEILATYENGLQIGGGITAENATKWLECGASKVIVTSYLFPDCIFSLKRLQEMEEVVGKDKLVVDLSCRRRDGEWVVCMNKWKNFTDCPVSKKSIGVFEEHCSEILVHGADVEGLCGGIDETLVEKLGLWCKNDCTYAGGGRTVEDLDHVNRLSKGKIDFTFGSALDIFGGSGVTLTECISWNKSRV